MNSEYQPINVEEAKSRLLYHQTSKDRFKLTMSKSEVYNYLLGAIMVEVESRHNQFIMTNELGRQLNLMTKFLTSTNPKTGIILIGKCGNGKTTLIRALQSLLNLWKIPCHDGNATYWGMQIVTTKDAISIYRESQEQFRSLAQHIMLAIDDLGTEAVEIMDYGNVSTPVIDLITKRYEEQKFTIISTNLAAGDIRKRYGDRIADRLNEMCERIGYYNPSYRTTLPTLSNINIKE